MTFVDDYELGCALIRAGARHAGRDPDHTECAIADRPDIAEAIGAACRPAIERLASTMADLVELLDDPRIGRVLQAVAHSPEHATTPDSG